MTLLTPSCRHTCTLAPPSCLCEVALRVHLEDRPFCWAVGSLGAPVPALCPCPRPGLTERMLFSQLGHHLARSISLGKEREQRFSQAHSPSRPWVTAPVLCPLCPRGLAASLSFSTWGSSHTIRRLLPGVFLEDSRLYFFPYVNRFGGA